MAKPDIQPTVAQEITDRTAQREKLARFFRENPETVFSQETLADACHCDPAALRTRISELKLGKFGPAMDLRSEKRAYQDRFGVTHRGKHYWSYWPRPAEPLGRDASTQVPRTLFDLEPLHMGPGRLADAINRLRRNL